jgi:hypothetical protein
MVEGDATLLMFAEMDDAGGDITEMDAEAVKATFSLMSWMLPVAGGTTYRKAPAIFRESLIFPYFQGMVFCLDLSSERGWQAIHAAYLDPPTSTEQILHPEKYVGAERDEAQAVTIPALDGLVPKDWKHLGGNCLGEFQTSVLLRRQRSGRRAAEGWDGDRYEVFQHADGRLGLVFVSVWDSADDAQQFAKSYTEYREPAKPRDQSPGEAAASPAPEKEADATESNDADKEAAQAASAESGTAGLIAPDAPRLIEAHEDKVWVIEGFDAATTEAIRGTLPQCTFDIKRFPAAKP